jgi:hypothetical protein
MIFSGASVIFGIYFPTGEDSMPRRNPFSIVLSGAERAELEKIARKGRKVII